VPKSTFVVALGGQKPTYVVSDQAAAWGAVGADEVIRILPRKRGERREVYHAHCQGFQIPRCVRGDNEVERGRQFDEAVRRGRRSENEARLILCGGAGDKRILVLDMLSSERLTTDERFAVKSRNHANCRPLCNHVRAAHFTRLRKAERLAAQNLRTERAGHTLQPTELVNEVWLRLARADIGWPDRVHFYKVAARLMRAF
jgi:hypothetical protein